MNAIVPRATLAFQNDLARITAEPPPWTLRLVTVALASLCIAVLVLMSVTRVDMMVTGRGRLEADHPTTVLQPLDRGIIREVLVRAGDVVTRGQVLATLDATFAQADVAALQAQQRSLLAEAARLQAEADNAVYPATGSAEAHLQSELFDQRRREYQSRLNGFDQQIAQDVAALASTRDRVTSLRSQMALARQVMDMRVALLHGAVGSKLQYLDAASTMARAAGDVDEAVDRMAELDHSMRSHQADRRSYAESWRRDVVETLATKRDALAQLDASLRKAAHVRDLVQVTAPVDGVVLDVAARGPGSMLREAEPLLTLLPSHAGLAAELTIKSGDIGYLRVGDPVIVKVDAYPFQLHGGLSGHVRAIAAASFDPALDRVDATGDGAAVHRVSVVLDATALTALPQGTGPMPGMTIEGDVRVGTRSVLAYFLTPITRGFSASLHEP